MKFSWRVPNGIEVYEITDAEMCYTLWSSLVDLANNGDAKALAIIEKVRDKATLIESPEVY